MEQLIFKQLDFIRKNTLRVVEDVTEEMADVIPEGFRNNIRWHLGHIYFVMEGFAFHYLDLPKRLPEGYAKLFANGTSPLEWEQTPPTLEELRQLLSEQQERVRSLLENRTDVKVDPPFTNRSGVKLETVAEFLNFNLYHEGMHLGIIKTYKTLCQ